MKVLNNSNNTTVIREEGKELFFSYTTLVAGAKDGKIYVTSKKYSRTTSKHINKYLDGRIPNFKLSPDELIDKLN